MAEAGGAIIDHSVIEEIGYEGALIDLPAGGIARLAEREDVSSRSQVHSRDVLVQDPPRQRFLGSHSLRNLR